MPALRTHHLLAATAVLLSTAPSAARAQAAGGSALPFHAGQWGLTANVGSAFGFGAVRFTAPNRALVVDTYLAVAHSTRDVPANPFDPASPRTEESTTGFASLNLALRRYRPIAGPVALFRQVGVSGSYSKSSPRTRAWSAGVFGDLGAQYMLDPRFSLAVSSGVALSFREERSTFGGGLDRTRTVGAGVDGARLIAAVYF